MEDYSKAISLCGPMGWRTTLRLSPRVLPGWMEDHNKVVSLCVANWNGGLQQCLLCVASVMDDHSKTVPLCGRGIEDHSKAITLCMTQWDG